MVFHLYGLLIGLGVVAAVEISNWAAKRKGWPSQILDRGGYWVIGSGIIGARIYHVVDYWQRYYRYNPISALWIWNGGLGIWGGIIGGLLAIAVYYLLSKPKNNKGKRIPWLELSDVCLLGVPLAQAIGRWGNFFNGELYGRETNLPWGIKVPNLPYRVHPLFLYESILDLALFWLMYMNVKNKRTNNGVITAMYLIGYGIIRLVLEPMRPTGTVWLVGPIPMAQVVSGVMIIAGLVIWAKKTRLVKN